MSMPQENEILTLLLGIGVLVFIWVNLSELKQFKASKFLMSGYLISFLAWILTNFEVLYWPQILNMMEHICYSFGSVLIAAWCWKVFLGKEAE